ncbi:MAG: DEAD/DEAH box helicase [Dehalococcoidia bacterium]|nr:DEAD/DEAH box helicase [Dehalococcoidia bacterium]
MTEENTPTDDAPRAEGAPRSNGRRPAGRSATERRPKAAAPAPIARTEAAEAPSSTADGDASFADLGVPADLLKVLEQSGISSPFPVQTLTIPDALAGRDVCGKAKTGSGKTLAFGIPLVHHTTTAKPRRPRSLVLVPTRELANQVAEALTPLCETRRLWLMAVYGGVSINRQIQGLRQGVDLVIATPGRLNDLLERGDISLDDVSMVVLDEADQMADMGFLPQVERILKLVDRDAQTLLFSATLDGDIGKLVDRYQDNPVHHEVISETTTVETLEQRFIGVTSETKTDITARVLAGAARSIVFVRTTHGADRLVRVLAKQGLTAQQIHGRKSQAQREKALDAFARGKCPILVATNVAARGLHIDHVDLVLHYDPPEDAKVYLHRSGRTARAGAEGLVVTLVLPEQERDVVAIQRGAGTDFEIVPMSPDDPRLGDLGAWDPPRGLPRDLAMRGNGERRPGRRPRGAAAGARNGGPNRPGDGQRSPGPWRRRANRRAASRD